MELKEKILNHFDGKVVRKDLASIVKGNLPVPTYVVEYLLAQYCASDDETLIHEGVEQVKDIIRNNYVHRAEAETVKSRIRENGRYRIIDKVSVELNDKLQNQYEAAFANLGIRAVPISNHTVQQNPKLLSGNGVWCILTMAYNHSETAKIRWEIEDVKPIQIASVNVADFIEKRKHFTTQEWIDLMIQSMGLRPDILNRRDKFILLARLLPHVENNFNFIELGPKGTGKSHVFQELSPHGVLVSGGDVTSARLFVRYSGNRELLGLIGYWDVVAWDEYEHQPGKRIDPVMIDTMQNYLANKSFNRGKGAHEASASMAFVGNTKHTVPYMLKNSNLFESIPEAFIKGAFLDRIHLYNPGWEVRVLKKSSFCDGFGFITDYLAELLHELRKQDFSPVIREYVKFDPSLTERDHTAIRKIFSGLMKLIYPDKQITQTELLEIIDFAIEGRKRVKDQLYIIDETFRTERANFDYKLMSTDEEIHVETLECINYENIDALSTAGETPDNLTVNPLTSSKHRRITPRTMKRLTIRENQTGISYENLFAEYLSGAIEITIEDPYIRHPYQIRNLLEFIRMIIELNQSEETIKIHLITWNTPEHTPDVIDAFDEVQDSVAGSGIDFTYEFKNFHDRKISTNNGWEIVLGRGLDIYEQRKTYSIEDFVQEKRRCKAFTITYIPQDIYHVPINN
jgi:ATP-dependent Lon protease